LRVRRCRLCASALPRRTGFGACSASTRLWSRGGLRPLAAALRRGSGSRDALVAVLNSLRARLERTADQSLRLPVKDVERGRRARLRAHLLAGEQVEQLRRRGREAL